MHGGIKGRSARTYASPHVGKPVLLKSDLKNFFPSVHRKRIYRLFCEQLKCSPDVARILTRLTTVKNQLPQGSPTSTAIANLVSMGMARRLHLLSVSVGAVVGTYVDDIAISGPGYVGRYKQLVKKVISQEGFEPNDEKTEIYGRDDEQIAAGFRVNTRLDIPSKKLREIRAAIEALEGKMAIGEAVDDSMLASILGKISHVQSLNKGAGMWLRKRLQSILRTNSELAVP